MRAPRLHGRGPSRAAWVFAAWLLSHGSVAAARPGVSGPPAESFDLGAGTLPRAAGIVGPALTAVGVTDRLTVGTLVAPWFLGVYKPGSVAPNAYAKLRLAGERGWGLALETHPFHIRLQDLDRDDLRLRMWVWPARLLGDLTFGARWAGTLELAGVYAHVAGSQLRSGDTQVFGVAAARTLHVGVVPRFQLTRGVTLWARTRALVGHVPVVARAKASFDERTHVAVRAQARNADRSSGLAAAVGAHVALAKLTFNVGVGYGTWFIPWLLTPIGKARGFVEANLYFHY